MISILSPAKSMNFEDPAPTDNFTIPEFKSETLELVNVLKKYSTGRLMKLMGVSEKIATLNRERYESFSPDFDLQNAKQALFAFTGDVYRHMRINTYSSQTLTFAQRHLRILSGLYGFLKPLDIIQPYRLEMKTSIKVKRAKNLYDFWGRKLTDIVNRELAQDESAALINLASKEYSRVINFKEVKAPVYTMTFKEVERGKATVIAIYAKWARGMMADHILHKQIQDPEDLKSFNEAGYQFSATDSSATEWIFTRLKPE